jgi:hypothetical protein
MQSQWKRRLCAAMIAAPMLFATSLPAMAQHRHDDFRNGARQGGHGGSYDRDRHDDRGRRDDRNQGGIGPGKGAAIGAVGGAVLGAVFGGGLKGAIIGGAAGAGVGAIAGKAHQDNQRRYYNGRPY